MLETPDGLIQTRASFELENKPCEYEPGAFVNYPTHTESGTLKGPPNISSMKEVSGKISGVRRQNWSVRKQWKKQS